MNAVGETWSHTRCSGCGHYRAQHFQAVEDCRVDVCTCKQFVEPASGQDADTQVAQFLTDTMQVFDAQVAELTEWWLERAGGEIEATAAKAIEYGSNSMVDLGRDLADLAGRTDPVSREEAVEIACFFYIQGKLGRWKDAIARGERPGYDTIYDVRVYAGMVLRAREVGDWPVGR